MRLGISGALKDGESLTWCSKWDLETSSHALGAHGLLPNPSPTGLQGATGTSKSWEHQELPGLPGKVTAGPREVNFGQSRAVEGGPHSHQQHERHQPCPNALGASAP